MDTRPLVLLIVLVVLAASNPGSIFHAAIQTLASATSIRSLTSNSKGDVL